MDQTFGWLAGLPHAIWAAILTPLLIAALSAAASRPRPRDSAGWIKVHPGLGILAMTVLSVLLIALFSIVLFVVIAVIVQEGPRALAGEDGPTLSIAGLLAPPLIVMFTYSAAFTFLVRHRFNEEGFEEKILCRARFTAWPDIAVIKRHWLLGPRLKLKSGKAIQLSQYYRGFPQLVEQAKAKGVNVDV